MPKMLNDGAVEYEDGTPATEAQVRVFALSRILFACIRDGEHRTFTCCMTMFA